MTEIKLIKIEAYGIKNSFRIPLHMTIQDTLALPSKTAIIGMIAAALGYKRSDKEKIESLYKNIRIGIVGHSMTKYYDLITIYKLKEKIEKSQLQRQINYDNYYTIFIDSNNLMDVFNAIKNPVFALTLGKADELINIHKIDIIKKNLILTDMIQISNTYVPFQLNDFEVLQVSENIKPLLTLKLPQSFVIKDDYRKPGDFKEVTFVGDIKLRIKRNDYDVIEDESTHVVLQ
jgi:CRISPR-associated Cas5-like protein